MAFGTGSHPTTALCLERCDELLYRFPGADVLDVGTAAASSRCSRRCWAPDGWWERKTMQWRWRLPQGAALNGIEGIEWMLADDPAAVPGRFEIVIANILLNTLEDLAPAMASKVADGGRLVLCGLLAAQGDAAERAYVAQACAPPPQGTRRLGARRAFPAVTMHRLFVPPDQLAASARVKLAAEQSRHLVAVLRLQSGAELEVFDGRGGRFRAVLAGDELEIGRRCPPSAAASMPSRPGAGERREDGSRGQEGHRARSDARRAARVGARDRRLERAAARRERSGGAGSRRKRPGSAVGRCPARRRASRLDGVVSLLRSEPDRRALLLDPAKARCASRRCARLSRVLIAVGPEGGFSPEERRRAQENGFLSVAMGPLVLRTETAGLAALAVVLHVNGELG